MEGGGGDWNLRDHAFDVEVGEGDLDALSDLGVEEVVTLRVSRVIAREVGAPEGSIAGNGAVVLEGARHRVDLLPGRYPEICMAKEHNQRHLELIVLTIQ